MTKLGPIETERGGRKYIPLPGGWEVQTKGDGSTFRIVKIASDGTYVRIPILDPRTHQMIEQIALDTRAYIDQLEKDAAQTKCAQGQCRQQCDPVGPSPAVQQDAVDAARYRWLLTNYAVGDGYHAIDDALIGGDADTLLNPAIDDAMARRKEGA